jgi:AbrB family looped-hinge helix DNA binding protein
VAGCDQSRAEYTDTASFGFFKKSAGFVIISWMKSMKARVAERGQVTIPKPLRERLGVKPGTVLEFSEEHGRLIAVKSGGADPVTEVYGCLGKKIDIEAVMAQLRGRR